MQCLTCNRFVSDHPLVASRVYQLSLRLKYVEKTSIRRQLKHTIIRVFGGSTLPQPQLKIAPTDLINGILNIANKLVNVRELYIYLWDLSPLFDLQPLFSSLWSSFGPKLYTLSFMGIPEDFRTLIRSYPILGSLRELRFEFAPKKNASGPLQIEANRTILIDLLPFINNLAPHLLSLKLSFWASLDLSTFFSQLDPFPCLKDLNVRTVLSTAFGDASGLKRFICGSSDTLQEVDLHLNLPESTADPSSEEPLSHGRWLLECMSDEGFFSELQKLQVLNIYSPNTAAGKESLLGCVRRIRTLPHLGELIVPATI
jgi:hypothetical protein